MTRRLPRDPSRRIADALRRMTPGTLGSQGAASVERARALGEPHQGPKADEGHGHDHNDLTNRDAAGAHAHHDEVGLDGAHGATTTATANAIARWRAGGRLNVAAPGLTTDAVNLAYADGRYLNLSTGANPQTVANQVDFTSGDPAITVAGDIDPVGSTVDLGSPGGRFQWLYTQGVDCSGNMFVDGQISCDRTGDAVIATQGNITAIGNLNSNGLVLGSSGAAGGVGEIRFDVTGLKIRWGSGSPEGVVSASRGSLFLRTDGGAGTSLYVKESGSGNTGWVGK